MQRGTGQMAGTRSSTALATSTPIQAQSQQAAFMGVDLVGVVSGVREDEGVVVWQVITRAQDALSTIRTRVARGERLQEGRLALLYSLAFWAGKTVEAAVASQEVGLHPQPWSAMLSEPPHLTAQQRKVLALLYDGLWPEAIARHLGRSINTVNKHIYHACRRLEASGGPQAAIKAYHLGLLFHD